MKIVDDPAAFDGGRRYRTDLAAIGYGSVTVSARGSRTVTVVSIRGEVDGSNRGDVSAYIVRSVLLGNPLLLDLSGVTFFAVQGISTLFAAQDACRRTGLPWALVAGEVVEQVLRCSQQRSALPIASSMPAAMAYFAHLAYIPTGPRRPRGRP